MPYCPKCYVELAPRSDLCPLCGSHPVTALDSNSSSSVVEMHSEVPFAPDVRNADENEKLTPKELRKMVVELLAVSIGIVLTVTILIDLIFFKGISWSRFTSIALVILWLTTAIPLILWKHPWLIFSVLGPSFLLAVFLWFVFTGNIYSFLTLGMPITLLMECITLSSGVLIYIQSKKGLNAVGVVLAAIGIACTGIDIILTLFFEKKFFLSWSIIVGISAIPVSGFFFYLHYRVTNRASLKKLFRL
ncbi:MAG TPA: hypothetical protein PK771_07575 [Spirochaetota bacterium]|nr:hypothetical protein [Spirochaetota bacterium]